MWYVKGTRDFDEGRESSDLGQPAKVALVEEVVVGILLAVLECPFSGFGDSGETCVAPASCKCEFLPVQGKSPQYVAVLCWCCGRL
jgi:hypothetical protein